VKLIALVPPRRDGTVRVSMPGGPALVFAPSAEGELACEVDGSVAAALLATGNFRMAGEATAGRRKGGSRLSAVNQSTAQEQGGGDLE
jgi:hypothetical protein